MDSCSDQMHAAALEVQKTVRKYFVVELNFQPESLRELDDLSGDVWYAFPGGKSEANLEFLARTWGAYLGEVLCRHAGYEWRWDEQGESPRPSVAKDDDSRFPIEFARQALEGKADRSFVDYFHKA